MADRTAIRLVIDLGFAAAVVACGITAYATSHAPDIPPGLCEGDGGPRYDALLADGTITIAAVFGELAGGPADPNGWSYRAAEHGLRMRGFTEVAPERFRSGAVTVDLALIPDDPVQTTAALTGALASHDILYYNGHSHGGAIELSPGADYRILVLDSCWSTQHFADRLVAPNRDVITNSERSVTGSIESFFLVLDGVVARAPAYPLAEMNERAAARARTRAALTRYKEPERYRLDVPCLR